mgnify:CR=1 FL=1
MAKTMGNSFIAALGVLAVAMLTAAAAPGSFAEERVHFAHGAHGTTLHGQVTRDEAVVYVIGAKAGQAMTLHLDGDAKTSFDLAGPKDSSGQAMASGETEWSGKLPEGGDYRILVLTQSLAKAPFSLQVTIE